MRTDVADAPPETQWTIGRLLTWTTDYFTRAGITTARLDAEVLLAHALGQARLDLYRNYAECVCEEDRRAYRDLIRRRSQWEPVAYITGVREFYSLAFQVSSAVLIPRPETEHLVEHALLFSQRTIEQQPDKGLCILDIGTGCGNIAIALAKHIPLARVICVDISGDAIAVARRNLAQRPEISDRVTLIQGSLLQWLHSDRARFHIIVSNPPYVPLAEWETLPADVRRFEPKVALLGGARGTEIQETILTTAAHYLYEGGLLLMELGHHQDETLLSKAIEIGRYEKIHVLPDYAGLPRVLVAEKARTGTKDTTG